MAALSNAQKQIQRVKEKKMKKQGIYSKETNKIYFQNWYLWNRDHWLTQYRIQNYSHKDAYHGQGAMNEQNENFSKEGEHF